MKFRACPGPEGWGPVSRSRQFDFTLCFSSTLLASLCLLAVLLGWTRLWLLRGREQQDISRASKAILLFKRIVTCIALLTSGAKLAVAVVFKGLLLLAASQILLFTTFFVLLHKNHLRSRKSSTHILLTYFFYFAFFLTFLRTTILSGYWKHHVPEFALECVCAGLVGVAFSLELIGPTIGEDEGKNEENPAERANVFSRWFFMWLTPLMKLGASKFITEDDVYPLSEQDKAGVLAAKLAKALDEKHSLPVSLVIAYGAPFAFAAFLKVIQDLLAFSQPQLLRLLLSFIARYQHAGTASPQPATGTDVFSFVSTHELDNGDAQAGFSIYKRSLNAFTFDSSSPTHPDPLQGFLIAGAMFLFSVTQSVVLHAYFQRCYETGMRIRAGLIGVIYRKSLVLSDEARGKRPTGDVVNLASVDATRLMDLCTYGLIAISGPFQITLAFVSLYDILGWPAFVGVAIMIVTIPLNTMIARYQKKLQEQQMKNSDRRTRLMSELLNNIKSVKLYSWEESFIKRVDDARDKELKQLRKIGITAVLSNGIWTVIPLLVSFSSFAVAAYTSSTPLTADVIFPSMSLFLLLGFPLAMFSQVISSLITAMVSVKRLSDFLTSEELEKYVQVGGKEDGEVAISVTKADFRWSRTAVEPILEGINLTVKKGELVGVLGRVGCGKSSLLAAIIGQMELSEGEVRVQGSVAYVPQNPWIMSASVRENIVFAHEFDEEYYNAVIDACELRHDLSLLGEGDMTEVGEKGITLSGGQRARLSLARACYARADVYILDDVLAALDSHVARRVFDNVIGPAGLLSDKARVVVTNSVAYLKQHDFLILIRRGIILESGTYPEVVGGGRPELSKLITENTKVGTESQSGSGSATPATDLTLECGPSASESSSTTVVGTEKKKGKSSTRAAVLRDTSVAGPVDGGTKKEHREQGRVKREVYQAYISSSSVPMFTMMLAFILANQAMAILSNWTLKDWADENEDSESNSQVSRYLIQYGLFSLASGVFSVLSGILLWVYCIIRSSRYFHNSMLHAILRSPLSYFDSTPSGRVLNLFSRDVYVLDQVLGRVISGFFRTCANVLGIVIVLGISFPLALPVFIPFAYIYHRIMIYYLSTSRELKRLDSVSRSPIFTWFQESLGGLDTIRAFGQQNRFISNLEHRIDRNQMCYMGSITVNRWLGIRLELLGSSIILFTAVLSLCSLYWMGGVNAGLVGLVLSYCLSVTGSLNWVVRSASEVEQNIVSVERILSCTELPSEAALYIRDSGADQSWPTEGEIEFRNYSMRYRPELPLVLNEVSLRIPPRAKVGVCGRTGAGKSSLLLALFRVIEPTAGTIYIDGVDITKLGLHELRTAISIIPQEPQLFEGTMRENIDPTGVSNDLDIWEALQQAHLKDYVLGLPGGLDAPVREGGSSLSSGQRQLLCFARALLRNTKVIVLDEATSAVDLETDKAIQEIIRGPQFANITMLTIAHRLNTIIQSDSILVLDSGKVAEFDTPATLLADKDSMFYSLAQEAKLLE